MEPPVTKFPFANGEIIVKIPTDIVSRVKPVSLAIGNVNMRPTSGFKPIRVVANIVLVEQSNSDVQLTDLPQPVEIEVRYRLSDHAAAAGKPLALAFWDGEKWVYFSRAKHSYELMPDEDPQKGGVATITITRWGDPPIAWGT
jgi:hypothetical protein